MRLEQRLIELSPGGDFVEFLEFDGKPDADRQGLPAESQGLSITAFRDRYGEANREPPE